MDRDKQASFSYWLERMADEADKRERNQIDGLDPDDARSIAKLLLAGLQESKWKPISEAPKDGTEVIVFDGHTVYSGVSANIAGQWRFDDDGKALVPQPTHWMPLPSAPLEENR